MAYRDDREALHNHVAQLEQDLEAARREGEAHGRDEAQTRTAELEQRLAAMRSELEKMGAELAVLRGHTPPSKSTRVMLIAVAGVLLVVGLTMTIVFSSRGSAPPPSVSIVHVSPPATVVPVEPPAPPQTIPLVPLTHTVDPSAQASPRSTTARWNARVSRAEGIAVAAGSTCTVDATITTTETNALVRDLSIQCGAQNVYRSTDKLEGMAQMYNDAREQLGPTDDKSTFTLAYRDIGTRSGERNQLDLDTTKRQGSVFRDTIPRFRVELALPVASVAGTPLSGAESRMRHGGKVTAVDGAAPVKAGATCVLRAMPTGKGSDCLAEVACGATVLWPSSAPVKCTYEGSRPATIATDEGPTTLSLDGPTLTLKAKTFSAVIQLDGL